MIRPNTAILGKCGHCPGTVTRYKDHTPSCEVCGTKYPKLAAAPAVAQTGGICAECGYYSEVGTRCAKCEKRRNVKVGRQQAAEARNMSMRATPRTGEPVFTAGEG